MISTLGNEDERPPSSIRRVATIGVCARLSEWCATWIRALANVRHISDPMLSSRFRNHLDVLDING
jgi:hypothetical protein